METVFAWLIGLFNIAVAAVSVYALSADWGEFLHGDYARAYGGSSLLDVIVLLGAAATCACLVLRRGNASLFQRAVAWGLLLRYGWERILDNIRFGEGFPDRSDWPNIILWGAIIVLALYSSRSLRRTRSATADEQSGV